jgi:hypothetical protein
MFGCSTKPAGSNLVKTNFSTYSSSGTPYCNPIEMAIAKQFSMLRMVAPSLAISIKISPMVPSAYSPVRRKMVWPLILAFCVKPRRLAGRERRSTMLASLRFSLYQAKPVRASLLLPAILQWSVWPCPHMVEQGLLLASSFCCRFLCIVFFLFIAFIAQRLRQFGTITVEGAGFQTQLPAQQVRIGNLFYQLHAAG